MEIEPYERHMRRVTSEILGSRDTDDPRVEQYIVACEPMIEVEPSEMEAYLGQVRRQLGAKIRNHSDYPAMQDAVNHRGHCLEHHLLLQDSTFGTVLTLVVYDAGPPTPECASQACGPIA